MQKNPQQPVTYSNLTSYSIRFSKDVRRNEGKIQYKVKWKSATPEEFIDSERVHNDFPKLLLRFFEKMVEWYTPYPSEEAQQAGLVSRPHEKPVEIVCKFNKCAKVLMFSPIYLAPTFMVCL